ncbi:stress enhanced protein 1, chloroplastic-like [Olea europaea var. sylvestris]|uniref:stress enhanced protein 1, chloroplastic-like n=1 Tax=Olea europaea var. sylvestris TaxID=158386 RepID=UPI000C1D6475|nr:stress enhanced protein 1, chloroplastic-like [Olea europaea var. sylvestris]
MAMAQVSNTLCYYTSIRDVFVSTPARLSSNVGFSRKFGPAFATGSSSLIQRPLQRNPATKATSVSIRCEQRTKDSNGLDVWLGRLAMVGFATAISIEIATGKGLLENFGLTSPMPAVALAVTALVGVLTAVFIFQSASKN